MVNVDKKVDYAPHYLAATRDLKTVHDLVLEKKFSEARIILEKVMVDIRLMRTALMSHDE